MYGIDSASCSRNVMHRWDNSESNEEVFSEAGWARVTCRDHQQLDNMDMWLAAQKSTMPLSVLEKDNFEWRRIRGFSQSSWLVDL